MNRLKNHLLVVAALAASVFGAVSAQAIPTWAQSYGVDTYDVNGKPSDDPFYGSGHDYPVAMAKMPDGGFVVAGQLDLSDLHVHVNGLGPTGALVRFAADGTILWQTELLQTNNTTSNGVYSPAVSHVHAIAADAAGNIFVGGGKGNTSNNGEQPFVAKFSPDGVLLWDKGFDGGSAVVGTPPQTVPLGVATIYYLCLTNDGGVAVTLAQSRPNVGYSIPVLAKFNPDGTLAFSKAYDNSIQYLGSTPVCQSKDGLRYVMAFVYATDGSALGDRYGLYLLVTDASGNIVAQKGYNHSDGPGETPVAIVATADGGFATLSQFADYAGGMLRKFNSDLSAETFERRITITPGQARGALGINSMVETADGGFLLGGFTQDQNGSNPYDAMLMKLNSAGALQSISLLGGPKNEGGPLSYNPTTSFAIETTDGGYGLAATSQSYHVGKTINGGFSDIPDWWMAKTDANRKVRNFTDTMLDQPLNTYTLSGSPEVGANPTAFSAPNYPYGLSLTTLPAFVLVGLETKSAPDLPTLIIQASSPRIVSSHTAEAIVGQHFAYHIITAFFPADSHLTYSATGLPQGFVVDPNTGVISGLAPAGSETVETNKPPIPITVQATDGTDTATATVNLAISDGPPLFTVNGSSTADPTVVPDSILSFAAQHPGTLATRIMNVEATTTPANEASWQRLVNGSNGYMTYDSSSSRYVLNSSSYPQLGGVYFRSKLSVNGRPSVASNVVGPFNLASNATRSGQPLLSILRNGIRADFDFRVIELSAPANVALRVQSSTTPGVEGSWRDLQDTGSGQMKFESGNVYSHASNNVPLADGVYFRAVASGGAKDSLSNIIGPFNLIADTPPTVTLVPPPGSARGTGTEEDPLVFVAGSSGIVDLKIQGSASFPSGSPRGIKRLAIMVDGSIVDSREGSLSITLNPFSTSVIGRHTIELLAIDDLGATARAGTGALFFDVQLTPPSSTAGASHKLVAKAASAAQGSTYDLVKDNADWSDPTAWSDFYGNHRVPGPNDQAVIGSLHVKFSLDVEVGALTLIGNSRLVGPGILTVRNKIQFTRSSTAAAQGFVQLTLRAGGLCEMLNDADIAFDGVITNYGTWKMRGRGSLVGLEKFDNKGTSDFHMPLLNPAADLKSAALNVRVLSTQSFLNSGLLAANGIVAQGAGNIVAQGGGNIVAQGGGNIVAQGGGNLVHQSGGTIVAQGGGNIVAQGGGNIVAQGGGNIVAQGGGNLVQQGSLLIGQDGASIVAQGGGNIVAQGAGNIVAQGGGNIVAQGGGNIANPNPNRLANVAGAATSSGYVQTFGTTDMNYVTITGNVEMQGGVLSGSGMIDGSLAVNGGFIAPGHSAGLISVTGDYSQAAGATMILEASGGEIGQFDQIVIGGTAQLGGKCELRTTGGYVPFAGDAFNPLAYASLNGAFASISSNAQLSFNPTGALALIDASAPQPGFGQPLNISTRMRVLTGDNVLIGGFIVTGPNGSSKKVMIRGLGPSLANAGLTGLLSDPLLELHKPDGSTATNDNWADLPNKSEIPSGYEPQAKESVIVATLAPGNYTVIERGAHGEVGVGLTEIFDLNDTSAAQLGNISTRGFVDTGDNVLIGGFIVGGSEPGEILVRAVGPSLVNAGLTGVLEDPLLELHDANGSVFVNDNWRETQESEITATTIPPVDNREPAIRATLVPGNYTVIVRGKNETTGIGLVEVYKVK